MADQRLCDSFFDMDNVVTVNLLMPEENWTALRRAEPHGGKCAHDFAGDRYDWYEVPQVELSGSAFPLDGTHVFRSVGLRKRSYCGSFSKSKPSLAIDFGKYVEATGIALESVIGTRFITLNNSRQDTSRVRQALGYELFKRADLPYSRCNFSYLFVNGQEVGLYVNVEPIKAPYVEHNFNGNVAGNLYEVERGKDLTMEKVDRISLEGLSAVRNRRDLTLAAETLTAQGAPSVGDVIDTDQFLRYYAMEVLLKHWDGYTGNTNNAFLYNDVQAVTNPTLDDVNFKLIPWGLDQILQGSITSLGSPLPAAYPLDFYDESILAGLVLDDVGLLTRLKIQVKNLVHSVFDEASYNEVISPLITKMENVLLAAGRDEAMDDIKLVRRQLVAAGRLRFEPIGDTDSDLDAPDWLTPVLHALLSD